MSNALFVPIVIGVMAVAQVTLNSRVAAQSGLGTATAINMTIGSSLAAAFAFWCASRGPGGGLYRFELNPSLIRWWWFLPGCFGFSLVVGLPWAVQKLGALATFVSLIGAQMVAGMAWDALAGGAALTLPRVLGAAFAVAGVALTSWK
ncbi:MAG: DMT family transporter [Polyangiaceae bacterium]